jgi:hypothetical protein
MAHTRHKYIAVAAGAVLAFVGAIAGSAPLFWHGWAHVHVTFTTQTPSGAQIFRRLGIDVDRPIAAIAEGQINRAIPPTLWQAKGHAFQIIAALLLLAALLALTAVFVRRWQRCVSGIALLTSIAAAVIAVIALVRIRARFDALPDTISAAIRTSGVLDQVVGYTTGRPQVTGGASWPLIVSTIGIGITLAGAALAFVGSLHASRSPIILPRFPGHVARGKERADGNTRRPAPVSDN